MRVSLWTIIDGEKFMNIVKKTLFEMRVHDQKDGIFFSLNRSISTDINMGNDDFVSIYI
jgi:predicted nucleic acid-binding protein